MSGSYWVVIGRDPTLEHLGKGEAKDLETMENNYPSVFMCDLCVILCTLILFVSINIRNCSKSVWYWTYIYQKTFILIYYITTNSKHMFVDLLKVFSRINMWTLSTNINVHIADWTLLIQFSMIFLFLWPFQGILHYYEFYFFSLTFSRYTTLLWILFTWKLIAQISLLFVDN